MKKFNTNSIVITSVFALLLALSGPLAVFAAGPASVNLGSAGNFSVLAKSGISTTGTTAITGNIGVSPIAATAITGFGLTMDSSNTFSTSAKVAGKVYAADYTPPTPATMTTAVSDMQTAYVDAAGRTTPTAVGLGAGTIGGLTLAPGLYKWGTDVTIPTDLTLSGSAGDVWIFQIAGNLNVSSGVHIVLTGGAQAGNVFWQVAGQTTLGTTAVFNGNILDQTAIVMNTGATLNGRALAQTAVTLDANNVSTPSLSAPAPAPAPVVAPVVTPTTTTTTTVVTTPVTTTTTVTPIAASAVIARPLINLVKNPSAFFLLAPGGMVTYTYIVTNPGTVALSNVSVFDNECSPVSGISGPSGDVNNNGMLDVSETWTYSCQMNLTRTLTNTATAKGQANGLTAFAFALATVTVDSPSLPNTGFPPEVNSTPWSLIIVAGVFAVLSLYVTRKRGAM